MNLADVMINVSNRTLTENGGNSYKSTLNAIMDLFAFGAAYRNRSDADCILLFKKALVEDERLAMKCLFYLRDCTKGTKGQGERRFFRVCARWLANEHPDIMRRNLDYIPRYGRWDDLYTFIGTPLEEDALDLIKHQLSNDVDDGEIPSLLAKWLPSCNTSSAETRRLGEITRKYLGMTQKEYRKTLSILRERINVLERLMSSGEWDEIDFSKLPSKAGFMYRKAFARRDETKERYEAFAQDKKTKVNAGALYPYQVVEKAMELTKVFYCGCGRGQVSFNDTERLMINKYWDNLTDVLQGAPLNGMCVCDTSGSMYGTPMNAAIALSMYCAEKASGPYHNKFITFSSRPTFVKIEGVDFVDKVRRMAGANWGMNTNLNAVFDLVLDLARTNHLRQEDLPEKLIILSDMQFDTCVTRADQYESVLDSIERKWATYGYQLPKLVFWNLNARSDQIPMMDNGRVMFCSGFSQNLFDSLVQDKSAWDLILDRLLDDRYSPIH